MTTLDDLLAANLSGEAQNVLTPQMKSAMSQGLQVAADLTPAYSLVDTLAHGDTPSPSQGIFALAGLATAINPVAGAAMMAAGALVVGIEAGLESLLRGLGLISDLPKPVQFVGLIKKGLPVPKDLNDPLAWHWENFARIWYPSGGGTDYVVTRPDSQLVGTEVNVTATPAASVMWNILIETATNDYVADLAHLVPSAHKTRETSVPYTFRPTNPFEAFFYEVLKRDVEYWANGLAYVDPRALLKAAVKAWNDKHPPAPGGVDVYTADERALKVIPMLLSSRGDSTGNGQRDSIPNVWEGPPVTSPPSTGPNATTSTIHTPATNAAPAQTVHLTIARPNIPPAVSDPLDVAALKAAIAAGWVGSGPLPAGLAEGTVARIQALQARQGKVISQTQALQKVTVAKPLPPKGWSTGAKVALVGALALGASAILLGAKD